MDRLEELRSQIDVSEQPKLNLNFYRNMGTINMDQAKEMLMGKNREIYYKVFKLIEDNPTVFKQSHLHEMSRKEEREKSWKEIQLLRTVLDFDYKDLDNPEMVNKLSIAGQANSMYSPGNAVRMGVHILVYLKAVMCCGTDKHTPFLQRAIKYEEIGCFALTELGHGSAAKEMMTIAEYDEITNEFIMHTPSEFAMKWWIGAAGQLASISLIWAQLYVKGVNKGLHGFLVPIRDRKTHNVLPGVTLGDCGPKLGNNSIDNGFISLNKVRIPYDNMLDRYSQIANGEFKCEYSDNKRFGMSFSALSGGRVSIVSNSNNMAIMALTIATRYAAIRQQFGGIERGSPEKSILEYSIVQNRIFPLIARTIVMRVGGTKLQYDWDINSKELINPKSKVVEEMHAVSSILKTMASWQAQESIKVSREIVGGHGYHKFNRMGDLYADNDPNLTWEGSNDILMQQTGKFILDNLKRKFQGKEIYHKSLDFLSVEPAQGQKFEGENIKDATVLEGFFKWKVNYLAQKSALNLQQKMTDIKNVFQAWNASQIFFIADLSKAYGEVYLSREYLKQVKNLTDEKTKSVMLNVYYLWALASIEQSLGIFRQGEYIDSDQAKEIRMLILLINDELKGEVVKLMDVIAPPDHILGAPMGSYDGDIYRKYINLIQAHKDTFKRVGIYESITLIQLIFLDWWKEINPETNEKKKIRYNFFD